LPLRIDFLELASYGNNTRSSGNIRMLKDLTHDIEGAHVLLVEDILDTGLTLTYAIDLLSQKKPASLSLATLLDKKKTNLIPRYTGFEIEDVFVVGYGMDYRGYFRNLDRIAVMSEASREIIDKEISNK
jgi:hypoxanthine phosphoribosyltransferase